MKFGRTVLLVGRNESGKFSLVDVLHALVMVIFDGSLENFFSAESRFRFASFPTQQFELDVLIGQDLFQYRRNRLRRGSVSCCRARGQKRVGW